MSSPLRLELKELLGENPILSYMLELTILLIADRNTMRQVHKVVKIIREMEGSSTIGIAFSGITERADRNLKIKLKRLMTS